MAEELGVSRNPVREAIRALASEGLIDVTARRGASVSKMSEQEARETIEVRAILEGHNAGLAARRQDKEIIKRIENVLRKGLQAVADRRFELFTELNQEFHGALYTAGRNTVLGEILEKLRDRTATLFAPTDPVRQARNWNEHAEILRAVIDGDERQAASLASEHVMRAGFDYIFGLDISEGGGRLVNEINKRGDHKLSIDPGRGPPRKARTSSRHRSKAAPSICPRPGSR